ncbi:hypothetical protein [Hyphomicrobium sp.]|uniref:hypothetical protein n=1 Tax=Hyphomicrobium sp. TaxID=82 RepID=UPI002D77BC5B|nr:hypothetical protein [Hyphomicrobium sp.]HET6390181.1 hypothetical protein [Hyphomicrobium sp.]
MIQSKLWKAPRALTIGVTLAAVLGMHSAAATSANAAETIVGTWAGGGSVSFSTGTKEGAKCRARFSKSGPLSYVMNASCATASARVDQSAQIRKVGANSYAGNFFNEQYNTGGQIRITVNGRSQTVRLSGEAGSAVFTLSKR